MTECEFLAIALWTSNLVYREVNKDLLEFQGLEKWRVFLTFLQQGLKKCQFHRGEFYRGLKTASEFTQLQIGDSFNWKNINAFSKNLKTPKLFSNNSGVIIELDAICSKDIHEISAVSAEEEVLFLPFYALKLLK